MVDWLDMPLLWYPGIWIPFTDGVCLVAHDGTNDPFWPLKFLYFWDPGITMTDSLVISRGCFQEVSGDGTVQCSVLSRGCYRSPRIIWDPGIILGFSWFSWLIVDLCWHCLRTSNIWRGRNIMFPKVTCMQTLKMTWMQTLKVICMQTLKVTCMTSKHYLMMHAPN